jgi:hypothetical protein
MTLSVICGVRRVRYILPRDNERLDHESLARSYSRVLGSVIAREGGLLPVVGGTRPRSRMKPDSVDAIAIVTGAPMMKTALARARWVCGNQ